MAYESAQEAARKEFPEFDHFDYSDIDAAAKVEAEQYENLGYLAAPKVDENDNSEYEQAVYQHAITPPQKDSEKLDELLSIVQGLRTDVATLTRVLRPIGPALEALPELMEKVDPLLEGLRTSPVLKMMGVKF